MPFSPEGAPVLAPFTLTAAKARKFLEENAQPPYNVSERFGQMDRYEAFMRGLQYKHQKKNWTGMEAEYWETISPQVVLPKGFESPEQGLTALQKRPSIETGKAATIVNGYTALLFSEQSCPRIIAENDEDTEAMLLAIGEQAKFWQKWSSARNMGGGVGSVAMTVHMRDGRMEYEVHNTKQITVLWKSRRTWTPAAFLKVWSVFVEEDAKDEKGKVIGKRRVEWCHRRIITEMEDVVYQPIRVDDPATWAWVVDPALSVVHSLGFFPGLWVQNKEEEEEMDGDPDCEGAYKQIDALDRLLSQINKACLLNLDPTIVTKTDEKTMGSENGPLQVGSEHSLEVGEGGDAKFLEMTGAGIAAADRMCTDLERHISDRTGYVFVDPQKAGGAATSSLAIKLMFRPMIQVADKLRGQYGPGIVQSLQITVKILRKMLGKEVPLPPGEDGQERTGVISLDLEPRVVGEDGEKKSVPHQLGPGGKIKIQWGPYFNKSTQEEQDDITNAVAAKTGGLIDRATAAKHVASGVFQVTDVEAMLARAEQEQADEMANAEQSAGEGVTGAALGKLLAGGALSGRGGQRQLEGNSGPSVDTEEAS